MSDRKHRHTASGPYDQVQSVTDLHSLRIWDHDGLIHPLRDNSHGPRPAVVTTHFRDLESHLCEYIAGADLVAGAVAWLTSDRLLAALSRVPYGVSVVVQKEDFLRPDVADRKGFAGRLRRLYDAIPEPPDRYQPWPVFNLMSSCADPTVQAVRCVGNHNSAKSPASPRMHNKFLVFCRCSETADAWGNPRVDFRPYAVWTGSFNFTKNATASFENAVYIEDPVVAAAYFEEFGQIMALSEPLDWESEWCSPEWRVGS